MSAREVTSAIRLTVQHQLMGSAPFFVLAPEPSLPPVAEPVVGVFPLEIALTGSTGHQIICPYEEQMFSDIFSGRQPML